MFEAVRAHATQSKFQKTRTKIESHHHIYHHPPKPFPPKYIPRFPSPSSPHSLLVGHRAPSTMKHPSNHSPRKRLSAAGDGTCRDRFCMRFHKRLMGDSLSQSHASLWFLFIGWVLLMLICTVMKGGGKGEVKSLLPFLEQGGFVGRLNLGYPCFQVS